MSLSTLSISLFNCWLLYLRREVCTCWLLVRDDTWCYFKLVGGVCWDPYWVLDVVFDHLHIMLHNLLGWCRDLIGAVKIYWESLVDLLGVLYWTRLMFVRTIVLADCGLELGTELVGVSQEKENARELVDGEYVVVGVFHHPFESLNDCILLEKLGSAHEFVRRRLLLDTGSLWRVRLNLEMLSYFQVWSSAF